MKRILLIGILIFKGLAFANEQDINFDELKQNLKIEQQIIFDEIFDLNEKLIDSYKVELKYLSTSDFSYNEKVKFLELKIKELEKDKDSEIQKLKKDLIKNPKRYKIGSEGTSSLI
ncbi:hypothetical protein OQE61_06075 [Cetobacterium somerae]|uniref:hypothetical protein n=1 Tax=Cetobacterium TaxID=180162 RepID=UPI001F06A024|nr:hypothetical protein [Cetobacterium somerae]MCX3067055.1 hypothetical protein [Cetobacterium somerae]UPO98770.1 hypothetical protein MKD34_12980 [Cetobacterium somerae]